jgi:tRNA (cytidine/uridine-2'-O-)-methyltransferase
MFQVVLFEPEIPPNTGNIIRLCANTGNALHVVKPLRFFLDDKRLRRAGLDYRELASISVYQDWRACLENLSGARMFAFSTGGDRRYDTVSYERGDVFVFGSETKGLRPDILNGFMPDRCLTIPMLDGSRSLNLSNAVAVVIYEAWRQNDFA